MGIRLDEVFVRELFKKFPTSFIVMLKREKQKELKLSFNRKKAATYLIQMLHKNGYSIKKISELTGLKDYVVERKLKSKLPKGVANTFRYIPYEDIQRYLYEMPTNVTVYKSDIKRILATELLRSGMTTKQVSSAVGISQRTAQRLLQRINDE